VTLTVLFSFNVFFGICFSGDDIVKSIIILVVKVFRFLLLIGDAFTTEGLSLILIP
jgi:hypothetical protein